MKSPHRRIALVMLVAALPACVTQQLLREGERLEREGQLLPAAMRYLDVLDRDAKNEQAMTGLKKIGPEAYSQGLAVATSAEQAARFPAAADGYQALATFLDRMRGRGLVNFQAIDANAKAIEMADKAAEQVYATGEQALAQRRWSEAIAAYKEAQRFKPGFRDTNQKIAGALYHRAEERLAARRWREAAQDFADSAKSGGGAYQDATSRSGRIYIALGRWFVSQGRCRKAADEFTTAAGLLGPDALGPDRDAALACARTPVAVLPLDNRTNRAPEGLAPGDLLAGGVSQYVVEHGSRFVPLVSNSALQAVMQARARGVDARIPDVRFIVAGELTQVRLRAPHDRSTQQVAGKLASTCEQTVNGVAVQAPCDRDVVVDYELHVQRAEVGVSGTVVAVDAPSGQARLSWPFDRNDADEVRYAANPTVGGRPVTVAASGATATPGVVRIEGGVAALFGGRRDPKPAGPMLKALLVGLGQEAGAQVLGAIDAEPPVEDPAALVIGDAP